MDNNKKRYTSESLEKAKLLKESLKIVDELGNLDPDEFSSDETLENLINKSIKLKKSRFWYLK